MFSIDIVTLMVLICSDILPSKVYAGSSGSSGSSDSSKSNDSSGSGDSSKSNGSKDNDEQHCKQAESRKEAIVNKIKYLSDKNEPLPACMCGASGTVSKIDIFNAQSGHTTTYMTCTGCTGPQVPVTSTEDCKNVPDIFHPVLKEFCQIVYPRCKNVTVYRCGCPAVSTTEAHPTTLLTPTSFTEAGPAITSTPLQATTGVPPPSVTTQDNLVVTTIGNTPFFNDGYLGTGY